MAKIDKSYDLLITDVDGVLNTGRFFYNSSGKVLKEFGPHDADAIKLFRTFGVEIIAISADKRGFGITERRLGDMGVELKLVTEKDRTNWVKERTKNRCFAFIGDGYSDIPSMINAKVGYAPVNALSVVKKNADIVLEVSGGNGVLFAALEHYISEYHPEKKSAFEIGEI